MSGSLWPALGVLQLLADAIAFCSHHHIQACSTSSVGRPVIPNGVVRGRKNPLHFGFAERLKRARRVADVSYAALGRQAGFGSRTTAALLENGERVPRVDTVEKLASALDVSPAWLAYGEGPMEVPTRRRVMQVEQAQTNEP